MSAELGKNDSHTNRRGRITVRRELNDAVLQRFGHRITKRSRRRLLAADRRPRRCAASAVGSARRYGASPRTGRECRHDGSSAGNHHSRGYFAAPATRASGPAGSQRGQHRRGTHVRSCARRRGPYGARRRVHRGGARCYRKAGHERRGADRGGRRGPCRRRHQHRNRRDSRERRRCRSVHR